MSGYVSGKTSLTTVQTGDIAADAVTLAKLAAGTDGNLITYDTSGNPAAVATGSSGQVLTSAGAGAAPTFAAGVALEFVSTAAITAVTTISVTGLAAGYDYNFQLEAFSVTDDAEVICMRYSDDDGSTYESGAADYRWEAAVSANNNADASDSEIELSGSVTAGNDANTYSSLIIDIINPNASSEYTTAMWHGYIQGSDPATELKTLHGAGIFIQGTDAVEAVQFFWSGGSTFKAQGDISVWRRKRS